MGVNDGVHMGPRIGEIDDESIRLMKESAVVSLIDGMAAVADVERMEEIYAEKRAKKMQLLREEEDSYSEEQTVADAEGTLWTYVTVRDEYARIIDCETEVERLRIPDEIAGLPVFDLAVDACSYLASVREIVCASSIARIENCAFRMNKNLERLVLPESTDSYDSSWVRGCGRLAELVLPGLWEKVTADVFAEGNVRKLTVGVATKEFAHGMFARVSLDEFAIDTRNPFLETDGQGVYSRDGERFLVLAMQNERYTVREGCTTIEKKAFANQAELSFVELPESLTTIGDYAFSYSGLERFVAPKGLRTIGDHAFFRCRKLTSAELGDSLILIGDHAFTGTALTALAAPASLEVLGHHIATETHITFSGADASFTIASGGILELDQNGGLYRNASDGKHFVRLLNNHARVYEVQSGTVEIEAQAFIHHKNLHEVILPEGLKRIDDSAFRDCRELRIADFPSTLEELGEDAFLDTSLERVRIPAAFKSLGKSALITLGAHNGDCAPALKSIEVDEGNERFYGVPGLLIERYENRGSHVVIYADGVESVIIPDDVTAIDSYAFGGASQLRELVLSDRIKLIGMRGLSLDCYVDHIRVNLDEPIEGRSSFDFFFPDTPRSKHEIHLAFNMSSSVDLRNIFKHYDSAIANMHEFDSLASSEEFDVYGQAKLAIDRLADPVLMSSSNAMMLTQVLERNLIEVCEAIARHDDREAIDKLLELGILSKDNLLEVIEHVTKLQDAAMTGYLLEIKRRLFQRSAVDFAL